MLAHQPKPSRLGGANAPDAEPRPELAMSLAGEGYKDYRELLKAGDLDMVEIATPDHWHALPMIAACKAGVDIYVQKPICVDVVEGQTMARWFLDLGWPKRISSIWRGAGEQGRVRQHYRHADGDV